MGYHNNHEIPNYWTYAQNYVLQDAMFEPLKDWSLAAHLYMVSAWSAQCSDPQVPSTCAAGAGAIGIRRGAPKDDDPGPARATGADRRDVR